MIDLIPLLPECDGLVAHHARRTGGVSEGPFASLNLGFSTKDDADAVRENRRRFGVAADAPLSRWVVCGQVHGSQVASVGVESAGEGSESPSQRFPDRDAVFLQEPGVFALALSADCPLVLIADPDRRTAGIAHAGWRGTVSGVIENLVSTMMAAGSRVDTLRAAVSPGICGRCYPVGPEVFEACEGLPGAEAARTGDHLDLRRIHAAILEHAGVPLRQVRVHSDCSSCDATGYFSYRRDAGNTGRNGALIGWRVASHDRA